MTEHDELVDNPDDEMLEPIGAVVAKLPWMQSRAEQPSAPFRPTAGGPIDILVATLGHDEACRTALRSGAAFTCQCRGKADGVKSFAAAEAPAGPADDAAIAIGLALRYARLLKGRSLPLPHGIVQVLVGHVDAGDPAAVLVWQWCVRQGLINVLAEARPKLRVVSGSEVLP